MENAKEILMTKEGLEKLENELEELKVVRRKEVAEKIKQALAFGDLSENSEYDEAKNEQAQVEARIAQIEGMLKVARVVDNDSISTDAVSVGTRVKLLDVEFEEEEEYAIVGSSEADPSQNRLSYESPVGKALLGKKVGDVVEVEVPAGKIQFKVLDISR
jgi:transcription elongation factor GreA